MRRVSSVVRCPTTLVHCLLCSPLYTIGNNCLVDDRIAPRPRTCLCSPLLNMSRFVSIVKPGVFELDAGKLVVLPSASSSPEPTPARMPLYIQVGDSP